VNNSYNKLPKRRMGKIWQKIINGIEKKLVFLVFAIGFGLLVFGCEQGGKHPQKILQ